MDNINEYKNKHNEIQHCITQLLQPTQKPQQVIQLDE